MELIKEFWTEVFTTVGIAAIMGTLFKNLLIDQIKKIWGHLRKEKKAYYVTCGVLIGFVLLYSLLTIRTQVNLIQAKFDKYENLKSNVRSGLIILNYEKLVHSLEKKAIDDFYILQTSKSKVNFPNKLDWLNTHLTNIFGIIYVNKDNNEVFFEYKSVVGKNKLSNTIFYTEHYIKDNPELFSNYVILQGKDKGAFLGGSVDICTERPLKKNLIKMEKEINKGNYIYNVCDFLESFFYTTGRVKGHEQKTFNEINHIYYILIPYKSEGESKLYFYYAFNSDQAVFLDKKVHAILETFLKKVNLYKEEIKFYENNNKAD